jgi:hypothetical protein
MRRAGPVRTICLVSLLPVFCVLYSYAVPEPKTSEARVEAAYIYNFAKFVEWPASKFADSSSPMRFCVLNDFSFEADLSQVVNGKSIAGRPVEVVHVRDAAESLSCHILFVNSTQQSQTRRLTEVLRRAGVLTVGETDSFVEEGGIINFFLENDQVQFRINRKAAQQAGLYVSSRLLSVAKRVLD